jgi:hypothetical protein
MSVFRIAPISQLALWQEGEGMQFHLIYINRPTPVRVKLAVVLNLPAILPVAVAFDPLLPSGSKGQLVVWLIAFPCVCFLWYAVGLWIDRQLGFVLRLLEIVLGDLAARDAAAAGLGDLAHQRADRARRDRHSNPKL